jgi:hypothetical protein
MQAFFRKLTARVRSGSVGEKTVKRTKPNSNTVQATPVTRQESVKLEHITVLLTCQNDRIRVVFQHQMDDINVDDGASFNDVLKNINTEALVNTLRPKITENELGKARTTPDKSPIANEKDEVVVDLFQPTQPRRSFSLFGKKASPTTKTHPIIERSKSQRQAHVQPKEDEQKLLECLNDYKMGLPIFIKYCHSEFSVENIELWNDLSLQYSKLNKPSLQNYIEIIHEKYISDSSPHEVNIPSQTKNQFLSLLDEKWMANGYSGLSPVTILGNLKEDIKVNLLDTWSRFEVTRLYGLYNGFVRMMRNNSLM